MVGEGCGCGGSDEADEGHDAQGESGAGDGSLAGSALGAEPDGGGGWRGMVVRDVRGERLQGVAESDVGGVVVGAIHWGDPLGLRRAAAFLRAR